MSNKSDEIKPKATAGIYAEVIKQVYDSLDKRFREAVSNAYDAHATEIKISVYRDKIILFDNGDGMSREDLTEKYVSMGGGDNYNNAESIGRIGIGALSIFAIGDKITINTRGKGIDEIIKAELDTAGIKKDEKHNVTLDSIVLGKIVPGRKAIGDDPPHFTEITITELSKSVVDIFENEHKTKLLLEVLEKILPLKYMDDDKLFDKLPVEIRKQLSGEKYAIDVIFHIPHLQLSRKLYRKSIYKEPNASISRIIPLFPFNLEGGVSSNLRVHGYLYINAEKQLPKDWQGINVRVKNVTIEGKTYFGYIEDQAARVRIGGELYIQNIDENHAIQSNRTGFAIENCDYIIVSEYMQKRIDNAISLVRRNSTVDSLVKKYVNQLDKIKSAFEKVMEVQDQKDDAEECCELHDPDSDLEGSNNHYSIETELKRELQKEDLDGEIIWSGTLEGLYHVQLEDDDYYSIYLNESLRDMDFDVAGNTIRCFIGYYGTDVSIVTKKSGEFYLNLDSEIVPDKNIMKLEVGFIKVASILYLNYLRHSDSAEVLYKNTVADLAV